MDNRWAGLICAGETEVPPVVEEIAEDDVEVLLGVAQPQQGVPPLRGKGRLSRFVTTEAGPFWLGVHGGAGESVLAELLGGSTCGHRWPVRPETDHDDKPAVFLVARQNQRGLQAARLAARDWACGAHPGVNLQGLVLMADAPGRTPRPLAGQTRVVSGGVPRTWVVPWIEELRLTGAVDWESMAREPRKVLTALGEAVDDVISERTPQ